MDKTKGGDQGVLGLDLQQHQAGATVVEIGAAATRRERVSKQQAEVDSRLQCPDCKFAVESEDDWLIALDVPATKKIPNPSADSGCHVCPNCQSILNHTVLDGKVQVKDGVLMVPMVALAEVMGLLQSRDELNQSNAMSARFNPVTAALNAVKPAVIDQLGAYALHIWPDSAPVIRRSRKKQS